MSKSIIVINPNSSVRVTAGIDMAMEPLRHLGLSIRCVTLEEGPEAIETQRESDLTIAPLLSLAHELEDSAAAFVVACFSDPGLHALRDEVQVPVMGIQECAVTMALTLGQRFGVISILPASIPRHLRAFGAMGVLDRLAADRAIGIGVQDLVKEKSTLEAMITCGERLRDEDGADVLIMGCAGMAAYRAAIEQATGLPVVEPCQAGASMALGHVALGYERTQHAG